MLTRKKLLEKIIPQVTLKAVNIDEDEIKLIGLDLSPQVIEEQINNWISLLKGFSLIYREAANALRIVLKHTNIKETKREAIYKDLCLIFNNPYYNKKEIQEAAAFVLITCYSDKILNDQSMLDVFIKSYFDKEKSRFTCSSWLYTKIAPHFTQTHHKTMVKPHITYVLSDECEEYNCHKSYYLGMLAWHATKDEQAILMGPLKERVVSGEFTEYCKLAALSLSIMAPHLSKNECDELIDFLIKNRRDYNFRWIDEAIGELAPHASRSKFDFLLKRYVNFLRYPTCMEYTSAAKTLKPMVKHASCDQQSTIFPLLIDGLENGYTASTLCELIPLLPRNELITILEVDSNKLDILKLQLMAETRLKLIPTQGTRYTWKPGETNITITKESTGTITQGVNMARRMSF